MKKTAEEIYNQVTRNLKAYENGDLLGGNPYSPIERYGNPTEKVPNLSNLNETNKDEFITEFIEMTAKNVLSVFVALGLETHIEATVVNDAVDESYRLSFKKINRSVH